MNRQDNFSKYQKARKNFPWFSYDSYRYSFSGDILTVAYSFSLSGQVFFSPQISIPYKEQLFRPFGELSCQALDNLVFHAGMIELVSYWKAACPPELIIRPFRLSEQQVRFWKKIYYHGLGEFFYLNSIEASMEDFMNISSVGESPISSFPMAPSGNCLVPVGGGKDSAVTMGILDEGKTDWLPMIINPGKTTRDVIQAVGKSDRDTVDLKRVIDPALLKMNEEGYLNGHTPFSATLAFYSLLAAYLTGRTDIILSNESSANEATVPGTSINHQYSKTLEFERDFRDYYSEYISPGFNYFSLLRPLSEIQIAKIFSGMNRFHPLFRSCNVGSKTGTWCGQCPKCLFTFIILSPFIQPETLTGIFGKNLLDDPGLENIYKELSGESEIKPFECIGTVDEVNLAMDKAIRMYPPGKLPYLLGFHQVHIHAHSDHKAFQDQMNKLDSGHFIPQRYLSLLENML